MIYTQQGKLTPFLHIVAQLAIETGRGCGPRATSTLDQRGCFWVKLADMRRRDRLAIPVNLPVRYMPL